MESGFWGQRIESGLASLGKQIEAIDPAEYARLQAEILEEDCAGTNLLTRLYRWEASFQRRYDKLARRLAEFGAARAAHEKETDETNPIPAPAPAPVPAPAVPRSAPCPCGSGEKYKRCCGKNAPPVLH
jgi:uncharacterized protein YecA (UPF0149 family)